MILVGGLDQDDLGTGGDELLALASEPPPGCPSPQTGQSLERVPGQRRVQRGGRVEADHEIELLGAEYVEVRRGPQPAVDVAPAGDRDRLVEPGDRARRRHGVGQVGGWRVVAPERHAVAVGVIAGHRPEARVTRPPLWHGAPHRLLERLRGEEAARHPPCEHRAGTVAARLGEAVRDQAPGPWAERRKSARVAKDRARGPVCRPDRPPLGIPESLKRLTGGVGDHEPRRNARHEQRAHHRPRRRADDVVGARGVPSGLGCQGLEPPGQPGATHHAPRAEHKPDPR